MIPVNQVHWTSKMRLLDILLRQNANVSLRRFLAQRRKQTASHEPKTWDDIAHEVRNLTGERVVRETMINYARAHGLAPERAIPEAEADAIDAEELAETVAHDVA